MNIRLIYITKQDYERLSDLVNNSIGVVTRDKDNYKELINELNRAVIIEDPKDIPPDVVTMNSRFILIDVDTKEEKEYTLVFPNDANSEEGKISILAPIGIAVLGYKAGSSIEWQVPAGKRRIKIKEILYQPEASGDYHL
ncbi:MAG: nucleoside diphosphate kinase regulator [Spirochaetes bacterium]|nr:nucleoside diphosphate kinase regulator [Spirochaetota bacterium]